MKITELQFGLFDPVRAADKFEEFNATAHY